MGLSSHIFMRFPVFSSIILCLANNSLGMNAAVVILPELPFLSCHFSMFGACLVICSMWLSAMHDHLHCARRIMFKFAEALPFECVYHLLCVCIQISAFAAVGQNDRLLNCLMFVAAEILFIFHCSASFVHYSSS